MHSIKRLELEVLNKYLNFICCVCNKIGNRNHIQIHEIKMSEIKLIYNYKWLFEWNYFYQMYSNAPIAYFLYSCSQIKQTFPGNKKERQAHDWFSH